MGVTPNPRPQTHTNRTGPYWRKPVYTVKYVLQYVAQRDKTLVHGWSMELSFDVASAHFIEQLIRHNLIFKSFNDNKALVTGLIEIIS